MNIRERILEKAPTGVRMCDVSGSRYLVKQEFARLIAEKLLIRKLQVGSDRPIYFDSQANAKRYLSAGNGLTSLVSLRDITPSAEVQKVEGAPYRVLDPNTISAGFYSRV